MRICLLFTICILFLMLPMVAFSEDLENYTIFSNDNLVMRDRLKIVNGLLGSNTFIQMGFDDSLNGNVLSKGNMVMSDRAAVSGNVKLSGTLTLGSQARVSGTVSQNASVPSVTIPTITFFAGVSDITVISGETRRLAPGAYRDILVSSNAFLYLESGTYSFSTLILQADAALFFNYSKDPIDIRVLNDLKIANNGRLIISGGSLNPADVRIYSHQTTTLSIGTDSRIEAVLTMPRAGIVLGDRTSLAGKLRAKTVTIGFEAAINGAKIVDSDGDGMPDGWETMNGLNPRINDAQGDFDNDGLKNLNEFTCGTKPNRADTDDDGLNDGDEYNYWGFSWDFDDEPYTHEKGKKGDGLRNIIDPDSDNDGLLDGQEVKGWTAVIQGTTKFVTSDPAKYDTDCDGIPDGNERDGYDTDFPVHTIHQTGLDPKSTDPDGDGIDINTEFKYGLDPNDVHTLGYMSDSKYYDMINQMGEWAVSPITGHLNPQLASTSTCILGANMSFGDDTSTEMSMDRQMELSIFLPQDGKPVTLKLDFVYDGAADPNDRFYDIKYSGAVFPKGSNGVPVINYPDTGTNAVTWKITDPMYFLKGDYFINFSYHYDKNNGEKPRYIRVYAYYDDGTRVRIEYISPVKDGKYKSPLHFKLLVAGGEQPAYFRGETAVSSASSSYIDNVIVTDYYGKTVRSIGKKAFNGYWFQYELGKLNSYSGGVSGLTACNRLEFDWVHDASTARHHNIFVIDEVGNNWDDVQITYQSQYATQDYYCWYGGLAKNNAVVRRGNSIKVIATNSSLQYGDARVIVKNRSGSNVTYLFNIHKESGQEDYPAYDGEKTTWRENWIIEAPVTAPAGMYKIEMHNGFTWSGSTSFYLIFNKSEMSLSEAEYKFHCYDEDADGLALDTNSDSGYDLEDFFSVSSDQVRISNPYTSTVTDFTVAAIDGKTTLFEARDAIRIFVAKLIFGRWSPVPDETEFNRADGGMDDQFRRSGVTIAEVLAGKVEDSHLLYGECLNFAVMSLDLSRSAGIPSRLVSSKGMREPDKKPDSDGTYKPTDIIWNAHVWNEAWIENPPNGSDKWYVFDSTDFVWTITGSSASRKQYGSIWMSPTGKMTINDYLNPRNVLNITSFYK